MAKKSRTAYLTAGELELMRVLWSEGPVTIAEAQRALDRSIAYPTVQTRLNRLVAKGIARRTRTVPGKYQAAVASEEVSARHLDLLLERVTAGSVVPLVTHLLKDRSLSSEEIRELKALLQEAEQSTKRTKAKGESP
jgi:predicted transcriptional regulator